ncbi:MAG: M15 family metallopeptidase, partial [Firmicutes bacterium]|nr:M15 family metallopeptidase [Bacillota bacterium]
MIADAAEEGLEIEVCSAYRTIDYQKNLIAAQVAKYVAQGMSQADAEAKTATEIIEPGASEHNLGLAVDLVAKSYQHLEDDQEDTAENKWLLKHCTEYGFILRYPRGKEEITGIKYEPWHFRYVGEAAAREIMEQGICLEEYLNEL